MANPPTPTSTSTPNPPPPTPLQQLNFTEADLANPSQFIAQLNTTLNNHSQVLNQFLGYGNNQGIIPVSGQLDLQGNKITGVAPATSGSDVVTHEIAEARYSAPALKKHFESGGQSSLISYRQLNNVQQRESSSAFLNDLVSTAPTANTSTVSATAPAGGTTSVTVSSGILSKVDNTIVAYMSLTSSLPVPGAGESVYYVFIQKRSTELFLYPVSFPSDTWANRISASFDGNTLVAVIVLNSGGLDTVNSAGGGTLPVPGANVRLFGRL
jgi:hypothetical protein